MNPRGMMFGALGAIGLALGILSLASHGCERKASAYQKQADQQGGMANAHAGEGVQADAQEKKDAQVVQSAKAETERLRGELAALRKPVPVVPPASPVADAVPVAVEPVADARDVLIAKQDEVIAAQDRQIKGLEGQVLTLTLARNDYRAAWEAERKRAELLELAAKAQRQASVASEWKSGLKGAIAGAALAYVAGRLH